MSHLDQQELKKAEGSLNAPDGKAKPAKAAAARVPAVPSRDVISKFRNQNADEESRMGFIDHLMELRKRLWISIITVLLCILMAFIFYEPIYKFLSAPIIKLNDKYKYEYSENVYKRKVEDHKRSIEHIDAEVKANPGNKGLLETQARLAESQPKYVLMNFINLTSNSPLGSMIMVLWLGVWGGLVTASPIVLYEAWAFISPGLRDKEKRAIKPILYGGVLFFLFGASLSYFYIAPVSLGFFASLDLQLGLQNQWTSETFIEMLLTMMVISGLLCEIPLLVSGLAYLDVLEPMTLIRHWRGFAFGSIALGACVSPGNDLASMAAFSGLMLGIYIFSILMAYAFHRKTPPLPGAQ